MAAIEEWCMSTTTVLRARQTEGAASQCLCQLY
ncbi:MAG: hypothetical protein JWO91_407 [Acidobacteriaceae bacterium]|nr:hypothetical protein [Acidobacteriaceae bacterium]